MNSKLMIVSMLAAMSVIAQDGIIVDLTQPRNWNNMDQWVEGKNANNNGTMYAKEALNSVLTLNIPVTLHAMVMQSTFSLNIGVSGNNEFTFVDADAYIGGTGTGGFVITPNVNIAEGGVLTKRANVLWYMDGASIAGAGTLRLAGESIRVRKSPYPKTISTSVEFDGGSVDLTPIVAGEGAASVQVTGPVNIKPNGNYINLGLGTASSIEMGLSGTITQQAGGILAVKSSLASIAAGTTRLTMANPPIVNIPGSEGLTMLAPWLTLFDDSTHEQKFATYDATKGVVPYEECPVLSTSDLAASGESSSYVSSINLNGVASGDVAWNKDVKVSGAVIMNSDAGHNYVGQGSLDFGESDGILWVNSKRIPGVANYQIFRVPIRGSGNVTIASANYAYAPFVWLEACDDFAGALHFIGCRLWTTADFKLNPAAPIYIHGSDAARSSQLLLVDRPIANPVFISGNGLQVDSDSSGAIVGNHSDSKITGTTTLLDDATLNAGYATLTMEGPIVGKGDLSLMAQTAGRHINLYGENTYVGRTLLRDGVTARLGANGTFGVGDIEAKSGTTVDLSATTGRTIANNIKGEGNIITGAGTTTFSGEVSAKNVTLNGDMKVNDFTVAGKLSTAVLASVKPNSNGATLRFDGEGEQNVRLADDGANKLVVVKTGAGEVTLRGSQSFTGPLTVEGGTLKFSDQVLPVEDGVVVWLDADAADTITLDEGGHVTKWASRIGSLSFGSAGNMPASGCPTLDHGGEPYGLPALEDCSWASGHKVVRFYNETFDRMKASAAAKYATVIFVTRPIQLWSKGGGTFGGLFGKENADYGQRLAGQTVWNTSGAAFFDTDGKYWINGTECNAFTLGEPQVLVIENTAGQNMYAMLGGYMGAHSMNPYRPYGGEICEMVAYNRVLSTTERRQVENYLSNKWYARKLYTDEPDVEGLAGGLKGGNAVTIKAGATLDMSGTDMTIASLAGEGTIVNTSDEPATLTVSGASTFSGRIVGDVRVEFAGGAQGKLEVIGGACIVPSGSNNLSAYAALPPTDGLNYWLDATRSDLMKLGDGDTVLKWGTRAGTCGFNFSPLMNTQTGTSYVRSPVYVEDDGNGKPAVNFTGYDENLTSPYLVADAPVPTRTLFIVFQGRSPMSTGVNGLWGRNPGTDIGIRFRDTTGTTLQITSGGMYFNHGDTFIFNGTDQTCGYTNITCSTTLPNVLGAMYGDWHGTCPSYKNTLGVYAANDGYKRGMNGFVYEVISYNRLLSDDEFKSVAHYLANKWQGASGVLAENTNLIGADGALEFNFDVPTTGAVTPVEWVGALDLTSAAVIVNNSDNLRGKPSVDLIRVTDGELSGAPAICLPANASPWRYTATTSALRLGYSSGTLINIR